jgi:hypothetical protein
MNRMGMERCTRRSTRCAVHLQPDQNGAQARDNAHTDSDERPEANSQSEIDARASSIGCGTSGCRRRRRAFGGGTRRMRGCRRLDTTTSTGRRS